MCRRAAAIGLLALSVLATGTRCGYRLAGTGGGVLPPDVKVVAVLPFENATTRPEIEQRVTEAVADTMTRRGKYQVVTDADRADAVLDGTVTSFSKTPVLFNAEGRATREEVTVTIRASVRKTSTDEVLWRQSGLIFKEQFDVPATGDFFDLEDRALDGIAEGAALVLVTSILEGF